MVIEGNKIVVFDVETKKSFDEVGGVEHRDELGISYAGVYSYSQDKLTGFWEDDLEKLEQILIAERPTLIGFNSIHFAVPVMQPYFSNLDLTTLPHLDILKDIEGVLGHRLKLDSVAQSTLYAGKSGSGLDAIRWYREGDYDSLAKYCLGDVTVTRDVYEYGRRHGHIWYSGGGEKKKIPMNWSNGPTIEERLAEAFKRHEQMTMEYFELDEQGGKEIVTRTVDILDMDGLKFDAFCHETNNKDKFRADLIWDIAETGSTFAHQGDLF